MKLLLFLTFFLSFAAGLAWAAPTTVTVRVKSKDAKFIGSTMGGALVVIRNAETGEVLAKGLTVGGTGSTQKIMMEPWRRGAQISDLSAAKFEASLTIDEPTFVTIEATGPMGQRQSAAKSSTQLWLLPGRHIGGDGVMLEIPGFAVDLLDPQPHESIRFTGGFVNVPVRVNVVMMCGCPITPGGLWDASKYEVKAEVRHNGASETVTLAYANKTSTFEGAVKAKDEGLYEVIVTAFDPANGNAGIDRTTFVVSR